MIRMENVSMVFNAGTSDENHALKNISLKIAKGDFITVIGSNGAGKSTLYNVIAGTLLPTGGRILLETDELEDFVRSEKSGGRHRTKSGGIQDGGQSGGSINTGRNDHLGNGGGAGGADKMSGGGIHDSGAVPHGAGQSAFSGTDGAAAPDSENAAPYDSDAAPRKTCGTERGGAGGTGTRRSAAAERDITDEKEYRRARYIGRIFQNPLLGTAGKMSLEDNMMICYRKGWKGLRLSLNNRMRSFFREQLSQLGMGLENRLNDNVNQFSGGQRQALTLLMAVMSKPALLLLDEHTAALDPANADIVMHLTRKFAEEHNLTVMMITHNMRQALDYGNRLLMMDSGEIILDISGDRKRRLTVSDIAEQFRQIKQKDIVNDQMVLQ